MGAFPESPQVTVPWAEDPRIVLSSPTAPNTCSLSGTDTQQEGQIEGKSQSRRRSASRVPASLFPLLTRLPMHLLISPRAARGGGPELPPPASNPASVALGGALTHLHGERPRWAPGPGPLAPDSRLRVRPAAAGITTRAARSRGRGEAGARAPGSCGPHGAPHSLRPGANPRARTHHGAPGPQQSGAAGLEQQARCDYLSHSVWPLTVLHLPSQLS